MEINKRKIDFSPNVEEDDFIKDTRFQSKDYSMNNDPNENSESDSEEKSLLNRGAERWTIDSKEFILLVQTVFPAFLFLLTTMALYTSTLDIVVILMPIIANCNSWALTLLYHSGNYIEYYIVMSYLMPTLLCVTILIPIVDLCLRIYDPLEFKEDTQYQFLICIGLVVFVFVWARIVIHLDTHRERNRIKLRAVCSLAGILINTIQLFAYRRFNEELDGSIILHSLILQFLLLYSIINISGYLVVFARAIRRFCHEEKRNKKIYKIDQCES
jgi:hypothetical protein